MLFIMSPTPIIMFPLRFHIWNPLGSIPKKVGGMVLTPKTMPPNKITIPPNSKTMPPNKITMPPENFIMVSTFLAIPNKKSRRDLLFVATIPTTYTHSSVGTAYPF